MSHYWAVFRRRGDALLRLDTRIYLRPVRVPADADRCLGCIVGKNPGSARPAARSRNHVAMELDGDRFLPNVRAIVTKAYHRFGRPLPDTAYVRVLNLFYLCDRELSRALRRYAMINGELFCPGEDAAYPWVWYAWGGDDPRLNRFKERLAQLQARHHFYFDGKSRRVMSGPPQTSSHARHTQGLSHQPLVSHLAAVVAS